MSKKIQQEENAISKWQPSCHDRRRREETVRILYHVDIATIYQSHKHKRLALSIGDGGAGGAVAGD